MSYAIDCNVLLHASDASSPFHGGAKKFMAACAQDDDLLCLPWPVILAYLRIVTHPSILRRPLSPDEAMTNVDALLDLSHFRVLSEEDEFWRTYREVAATVVARGNLVPDVHVASILRRHGVRVLYTDDSDFRRFTFLEVRNPFA